MQKAINRLWTMLLLSVTLLAGLICFAPCADAAEYSETIDRLRRLQAMAEQYIADQSPESDPIVLTLAFTRVEEYNTSAWQLTAGARDPDFESFVNQNDSDLANLQGVGSVQLPNGEMIDFSHLLASMNLVYLGMPITGSWGGDCMQLAQAYSGQASTVDEYYSLMQSTFNLEDDGTISCFGSYDMRADLDSVVAGSQLTNETNIADLLENYYADLTDYDRVYQFIALSFGSTDTSNTEAFRSTVYSTLTGDAGMELLLYIDGMWNVSEWCIDGQYENAMRAATDLFADYLGDAVNHEKVKADNLVTRMMTMASDGLAAALSSLGDEEAAQQALNHAGTISSSTSTGDALTDATTKVKDNFDVKIFRIILLALAGISLVGIIANLVLFIKTGRNERDYD